jgi:hypothetical protein
LPATSEQSVITAPFVGRATELHRLDELLGKAQRGQRQSTICSPRCTAGSPRASRLGTCRRRGPYWDSGAPHAARAMPLIGSRATALWDESLESSGRRQ